MSKSTRKGFTLVEVALAVAVGLIIIGGAVAGYNAVRDNASNTAARNRVLSAVTIVEESAASNGGAYPASVAAGGPFTATWVAKRSGDFGKSPWGGLTGQASGVTELAATAFTSAAAPTGVTEVFAEPTGGAQTANLLYVSNTSAATPWIGIMQIETGSLATAKNYAVGIYDKNGASPWFMVQGGK